MDCPEGGNMFLKLTIFKRLLKKAWSGSGLLVGCKEEYHYISSGWWCVKVLRGGLNKKEKAALIELIGEMPAEGEAFKAFKDGGNQYEVGSLETLENLLAAEYKTPVKMTRMIYQIKDKFCRVFQEPKGQNCMFVSEAACELVDKKAINELEESPPEGPFTNNAGNILYWENNIMSLIVCKISIDEETEVHEVKRLLENIELPRIGA